MSGRVRTILSDGRRVTGFRKTLRTNPRRDPALRRQQLLRAALKPPGDEIQVGLCFRLPQSIEPFVSAGIHGIGVTVKPKGFVVIVGKTSDHDLYLARKFLLEPARDKPAFCTGATLIANSIPDQPCERHLLVIAGVPALCGGRAPPRWCEAG
jgi:hypothetical protein